MQQTQKLTGKQAPLGVILGISIAVFITAAIVVGLTVYSGARRLAAAGDPLSWQPGTFTGAAKTPTAESAPGEPTPLPPLPAPSGPEPIPWDGASRVTVLVMGLDYRDWEAGEGPPRTDTMILLTVDPLMKTAGIMNIPRDLWVNIPGSGYGRINTAYPIGESFRLPGGGPGNAVRTVELFLGVPINYYAQVDFFAFERFIDEIGGVEVDVPAEIKVDPIGPGNTVILQPGKQTLDGPVALAYARARNTEGVDFDRAVRQQQVILAMLDRLLSPNMLPTLVSKAPLLYRELASGVNTNMELEQAIALAWLAPSIQRDKLKRGVISPPDQVLFAKSPDGTQDVLKPIPGKIRLLRDEIFAPEVFSPAVLTLDAEGLLREEAANISVMNGSGAGGLAARTSEYLAEIGANVIVSGDAGQFYHNTTIVDYTGNPYTVSYLASLMNVSSPQIRFEFNAESELDVVVYLGADWANSNPLP